MQVTVGDGSIHIGGRELPEDVSRYIAMLWIRKNVPQPMGRTYGRHMCVLSNNFEADSLAHWTYRKRIYAHAQELTHPYKNRLLNLDYLVATLV